MKESQQLPVSVHTVESLKGEVGEESIVFKDVTLFEVPYISPWTGYQYIVTNRSKDALEAFAKKSSVFGELGNPLRPIDVKKQMSIQLHRAAIQITNIRVEVDESLRHRVIADVETAKGLYGKIVYKHMVEGGTFRFLLRSMATCSYENVRELFEIVTFDLGIFDHNTAIPHIAMET